MTLKLNGSSSGYTAIDAPAAAGSNTLTLPADNGSANQVLKTDGSGNLAWVAQAAGGKILQIKTVVDGTRVFNPTDWTTAFSQAITPTSSSSKIIIIVSCHFEVGSTSEVQVAIYDGSARKGYREHRNYSTNTERVPFAGVWVAEGSYSAGTAYTFSFQATRSGGSSDCVIGNDATDWKSSMLVLEVDVS